MVFRARSGATAHYRTPLSLAPGAVASMAMTCSLARHAACFLRASPVSRGPGDARLLPVPPRVVLPETIG